MKTLYININNELIQSNEELEVLNYDLDSDLFFYLGEKIAKGCKVENENALITDFNTKDNEEDYKQIIAQWNELKNILFSGECEGKFELTLPSGFTHWLRYSEKYNLVYDKNFSHGESTIISIDLEKLYEDSVEDLQHKILRKLQRDDFYHEIDEIVFNDDAVTCKSPIILTIKEKYDGVGFKAYKKWLEGNKPQEDNNIPDIEIPNTEDEDYSSDDLTLLVNWICDEFEKERTIDCRRDEKMMSKIYDITKNALNEYETSWCNHNVDIWIPYVSKYDSNGNPIHTTNFKRTLSKGLLHSLKYPDEVENESWGWKVVNYLNGGLILKRLNYKYGLVDYDGIVIAQCEYNEIMQLKSGNIRLQKGGKFGLINKDKTINIPCIYDEIYDCEDGLFKVKTEGKHYKIDSKGVKRYIQQGKIWLCTNSDGSINHDLMRIISPVSNVVIGQTALSIIDKYVDLVSMKDAIGRTEDFYFYKVNGCDDIIFMQPTKDDTITHVMIKSLLEEYNKVKASVQKLGYKSIWNKDDRFLYQTSDKLFKILITESQIIIEYCKTSVKLLDFICK